MDQAINYLASAVLACSSFWPISSPFSTKSLVDWPLFFSLLIYCVADQVRFRLNLRFGQDFHLLIVLRSVQNLAKILIAMTFADGMVSELKLTNG